MAKHESCVRSTAIYVAIGGAITLYHCTIPEGQLNYVRVFITSIAWPSMKLIDIYGVCLFVVYCCFLQGVFDLVGGLGFVLGAPFGSALFDVRMYV